MGSETKRPGVWNALAQSFGDEFYGVSGSLLIRATVPPGLSVHSVGDTTLYVEGTHRMPDSGVFVVRGEIHYFTGATTTSLTGVDNRLSHIAVSGDPDPPDPGLSVAVEERDVVLLLSSDHTLGVQSQPQTDFDHYKLTFFIETAEGADLDRIARNHGIVRPRWLEDAVFRQYLMVMIALDSSTIYAIEKVLDVIIGSANYRIWEDEWAHPNEVFVDLIRGNTDSYKGKAFMNVTTDLDAATDIQITSGGSPTVVTEIKLTLPDSPSIVYGVWTEDDPSRIGVNYCDSRFAGQMNSSNPTYLQPLSAPLLPYVLFSSSDVGKGVSFVSRSDTWIVEEFLSPTLVSLGRTIQKGGSVSSGAPRWIRSAHSYFESWMEGHTIQIVDSTNISNLQISTIEKYINPNFVQTTNAVNYLNDNGGVSFKIAPKFTTSNVAVVINRTAVTGNEVLLPVASDGGSALPADILSATAGANLRVDYVTIPSSELCSGTAQNGEQQYPLYLWDEHELIQAIMDIVTAAGVKPTLRAVDNL